MRARDIAVDAKQRSLPAGGAVAPAGATAIERPALNRPRRLRPARQAQNDAPMGSGGMGGGFRAGAFGNFPGAFQSRFGFGFRPSFWSFSYPWYTRVAPLYPVASYYSALGLTCAQWAAMSLSQKLSAMTGLLTTRYNYAGLNNISRGSIVYAQVSAMDRYCAQQSGMVGWPGFGSVFPYYF
jgi:hypothetical protein